MKLPLFLFLLFSVLSCNDNYEVITETKLKKFYVQDTLVNKSDYTIMTLGRSIKDEFPKLLLSKKRLYLFDRDFEVENDSTILLYDHAFLIDSSGSFRKKGIWIHATFYKEGIFPFNNKVIEYSVDSIPSNWNKELPNNEGIYFLKNNELKIHSVEQSPEKFKEKEKTGFYFIPNKGRLFNRINVNELK